ncbi:MAG: alginate lyase family protein [Sedimentisphaerales bacterium]|nr:alginate lyase family protein [Sedimentisphaerales bacterium]
MKYINFKYLFIAVVLFLGQGCFSNINHNYFDHPGGLHSEKQLNKMRLIIFEEPGTQAYNRLIDQAKKLLSSIPQPMANYNVPYFYWNKKTPSPVKDKLSKDAFAAYTLALAYQLEKNESKSSYADKAIEILNAWADTNRRITGFDGDLTACYCGVPMVHAAELLTNYQNWFQQDREDFKKWLSNTLLKSAHRIKRKNDNHGCWGLYTSLACNHYLDNTVEFQKDIALLEVKISKMIDRKGELPSENKRTNSGMWYTYFALCPLTCSSSIATNATGKDYFNYTSEDGKSLKSALDALFNYCEDPDSWPYEKPTGLTGIFYNTFNPSADYIKKPRPDSWPGNLYEVMLSYYHEEEWNQWLRSHRPINGGRGWIWPTLTKLAQVPEKN